MRLNLPERPKRAWVCVLLALLILYNPFQALTTSYASYSVHGQERHRATVGASELHHLGCAQHQTEQDVENLQEFQNEFGGDVSQYEATVSDEEVEVMQPDLINRIWSRPPPLA